MIAKPRVCLALACTLTLQSFGPAAWAGEAPSKQDLDSAFANIQAFARTNEDPASAAAPAVDTDVPPALDARLYATPSVFVDWSSSRLTKDIIGKDGPEFQSAIANLLTSLGTKLERDTSIVFNDDSWPKVVLEKAENGLSQKLSISLGTLRLVENWDELAGVISQAIARDDPKVYGHRDDPRVVRRLEEQAGLDRFSGERRDHILADVSAMERLRACDLRPWGLTDYELRVFTWFRKYARRYYPHRLKSYREARQNPFFLDPLYEARILVQKTAMTYFQERENLRDLVRTKHAFPPGLRAIRERALSDLDPVRESVDYRLTYPAIVAVLFGALIMRTDLFEHRLNEFGRWLGVQSHAWNIDGSAVYMHVHDAIVETVKLVRAFWNAVFDALGSAADYVLGALWNSIVGILFALMKAGAFVLETLYNAAVATLLGIDGTFAGLLDWIHPGLSTDRWTLVVPLASAAIMLWHGRRAIVRAGLGIARRSHFTYRWALSYYNDVRYTLFFPDWILASPVAKRVDLLRDQAGDLAYIYAASVSQPLSQAYRLDRSKLVALRDLYYTSSDFPALTREFFRALEREVREGRVTPDQLGTILKSIDPETVPSVLAHDRFDKSPFERSLVVHLMRRRKTRRWLASLYRAAFERFPGPARPWPTGSALKNWGWPEFNGTRVPESQALGLASVAFEMERIEGHPNPANLIALHEVVHERLRLYSAMNRIFRANFAEFLAAASDGRLHYDTALTVEELIRQTRRANRHRDAIQEGPDEFPDHDIRLMLASARALITGDPVRAAATATWHHDISTTYSGFPTILIEAPYLIAFNYADSVLRNGLGLWLKWRLSRIHTMSELDRFVRDDLLPRNFVRSRLTAILYAHVVTHPGLLRDTNDIRVLLDHEIYWPETDVPNTSLTESIGDFFGRLVGFKSVDDAMVRTINRKKETHPRVWKFHAKTSHALHRMIVDRMNALGAMPREFAGLEAFWLALSNRGVTAETDRMIERLIEIAPADGVAALMKHVIDEGRVWETALHSRLAIARTTGSKAFAKLISAPPDDAERPHHLDVVLTDLRKSIPERGLAFVSFLENLSVQLDSTYDEAKAISTAKTDVGGSHARDSAVADLQAVFKQVSSWPPASQFHFIRFLRGEARPDALLRAAFPVVGLDRVRRIYETLPLGARVGVLDTFMTHSLIGQGKMAKFWTWRLSRHIVGGGGSEAQRVTLQILRAFLHSVREVGNAQMVPTILAYLYSLPSTSTASPVEVLKLVLELFGATGIKLGQFLYASQMLGADGKILRSLQSRARVPDRIEMYEDVYDLLGVPLGAPLPFAVLQLLGAASMKYAFMGQDRATAAKVVVKIFRLDAMNNVDLQFDVLERMGDYLIRRHGARYGSLQVIVQSARMAVKREGSMRNEIRRSRIAKHHVYKDRSTDAVEVHVPHEDLVNPRMIVAEFADGVSFEDLPAHAKPTFARHILEMEDDVIFSDVDVVRFDPDRHAGNSQLRWIEAGDQRHALQPIDFGQLSRLRRPQRDRIASLFALAQIAGEAGANAWVVAEVAKLLELSVSQRRRLAVTLPRSMKKSGTGAVTLYVSMLAGVQHAGLAVRDTTYVDFVRALVQLLPYETWAPDARSPRKSFDRDVRARIKDYLQSFELDPYQRAYVVIRNPVARLLGLLTGREYKMLRTDYSDFEFDDLIQRELSDDCNENLDSVG